MKRRELLKNTSLWISGMLIVSPSSVMLSSCDITEKESSWKSVFFSKKNANLLYEIIDTLIPNTEIPGAIAANVHKFVESYVQDVYDTDKRKWFVEELSDFDQKIKKFSGQSIFDLKLEDRINTLNQIQIEEGNNSFYVDLKRFVITGYFNSEIGVKQALNYKPIPGTFKGCIPLEESEGKSWS